ncbi:MAG: (4Fe-4S)-binding protein [Actinomycetota bacterium]|nr:(4Fe-4S)-binding protein [Actinomycetota bacterium]
MAQRTYRTDSIVVHWDSERCAHSGICLRTLPEVFDVEARPWVNIEAADTDAIAAAVERCPSGALSYERSDGEPGEIPDDPVTIVPWPHGPLFVRGDVRVLDRHGEPFPTGSRVALCRCGHSRNHPFCDATHRAVGFNSYPHAISDQREQAQSPADLEPPTSN